MPNESSRPAKNALSTLIAACASGFLFQFDLTALSAALPDIAAGFSARATDQAWVIHVYSLALIFALPLAGPVADRYGRRRVFSSGAALFAAASALCATADTLPELLIWRVAQGVAGAAITISGAALLAAAYPGAHRARAFGILGTSIGASMVVGPPLGAVIATTLGWSWVFWINVPICGGLTILVRRIATDARPATQSARLDWAGPATLALFVGSLAYLVLDDRPPSTADRIVAGACVAALVLFVLTERRHEAPAFDFTLFGAPRFVAICLVAVASSIGFWSLLVHLPQMARGPMALEPEATGILLTALTVPMLVLPAIGARLAAKLPASRYFAGGLAIIGAADLALAFVAIDLGSRGAIIAVAAALLIGGGGCALINAQITAAAVSALPSDRAATGSAIGVTMRQIGFAFGIALIGACLRFDGPFAYPYAFAVAGTVTLVLAAIVFALLRRAEV